MLLCALRRIGLAHTRFAEATCGTLRLGLLKIGALVRVSVRRVKLAMASAHPFRDEFALAHARLTAAGPAWRSRHRKPTALPQRRSPNGHGAAWPISDAHHLRAGDRPEKIARNPMTSTTASRLVRSSG